MTQTAMDVAAGQLAASGIEALVVGAFVLLFGLLVGLAR